MHWASFAAFSRGNHLTFFVSQVLINSWGIHHNAKVYSEPFSFRPERFLNDEGKLHSYDHPTRSK